MMHLHSHSIHPFQSINQQRPIVKTSTDWTGVLKQYQEGLEWCASQGTKHYEERHKERGLLLGIHTLGTLADDSSG